MNAFSASIDITGSGDMVYDLVKQPSQFEIGLSIVNNPSGHMRWYEAEVSSAKMECSDFRKHFIITIS